MNRRWLALLLLAGCSSMQWDKPGATPANVPMAAPLTSISAEPSLRRRHPFGSVGVAFVAGLALGAAKWLATDHFRDLKRRLT